MGVCFWLSDHYPQIHRKRGDAAGEVGDEARHLRMYDLERLPPEQQQPTTSETAVQDVVGTGDAVWDRSQEQHHHLDRNQQQQGLRTSGTEQALTPEETLMRRYAPLASNGAGGPC